MNQVALVIIQTLRHRTLFEMPAAQPGTTVQGLCLLHCETIIETVDSMLQTWPSHTAHWWWPLYVCMQPLVLLFQHPLGSVLFTRACRIMSSGARTLEICEYLLQATQSLAWVAGQTVPPEAQQYLVPGGQRHNHRTSSNRHADEDEDDGMGETSRKEGGGIHLSFALPRQDDLWDVFNKERTLRKSSVDVEDDLGLLILNWTLEKQRRDLS